LSILLLRNLSDSISFEYIITNILLFARYNATVDFQVAFIFYNYTSVKQKYPSED